MTLTLTGTASENYDSTVSPCNTSVKVFGLPVAPVTMEGVIDEIDRMIDVGKPEFLIDINLTVATRDTSPNWSCSY